MRQCNQVVFIKLSLHVYKTIGMFLKMVEALDKVCALARNVDYILRKRLNKISKIHCIAFSKKRVMSKSAYCNRI